MRWSTHTCEFITYGVWKFSQTFYIQVLVNFYLHNCHLRVVKSIIIMREELEIPDRYCCQFICKALYIDVVFHNYEKRILPFGKAFIKHNVIMLPN